jgi:hypothetical protein
MTQESNYLAEVCTASSAVLLRFGSCDSVTVFGWTIVGYGSSSNPGLRSARMKEIVMAKVIEFYVPTNFRTPLKGTPRQCGKVIEFRTQINKSA